MRRGQIVIATRQNTGGSSSFSHQQLSGRNCFDDVKINSKERRSPLHVAVIEQQSIQIISDLIIETSNLDLKDFDDKSALDYAIQSRDLQIIKLLIEAGAKIFRSSLYEAVKSLNVEVFEYILPKLIDYQEEDCNYGTLFELAVWYGNSRIVQLLLEFEHNFHVNIKYLNQRQSLLLDSIKTNNIKMVELLLDAGFGTSAKNKHGNTPLHLAVDPNNIDILKLLLNRKANLNAQNKLGYTPLHLAKVLFKQKSNVDNTRKSNLIKILLEAGADVNTNSVDGDTPLISACRLQKDDQIVKLLLNARADISKTLTSALHNAVESQNCEVVKLLLDAGASVEACSGYRKNNALHLAADKDNLKVLRLLLIYCSNSGVVCNAFNNDFLTPLHLAVKNSNYYATKILLEAGVDVALSDNRGYTPVHLAAYYHRLDIVRLLLEFGADFNNQSDFGRKSPFVFYVESFHSYKPLKDDLEFILEHSDVNLVNDNKMNILSLFLVSEQYAYNREYCYKYILEHVAKVKVLNQAVDTSLLDAINGNSHYQDYFNECIEELENAKSTKLRNCRVSYFNLLVDCEYKLIKYAGNQDLVDAFGSKGSTEKFPIYGSTIITKMTKGIEGRESFDDAANILSKNLPIFNPTHLIIRNTLDALRVEDWNKLGFHNQDREF